MLAITPRISLAAALSAIALLGGSAVASAHPAVISHNPPNSVIVTGRVHHDLPVVGGSTGQGLASEEDCEGYADQVNMILDEAQEHLTLYGNDAVYYHLIDIARSVEDDGLNLGCYFINPV